LEPSVVSAQQAVATITSLARQFGKRAVVWRHDPIAFTESGRSRFLPEQLRAAGPRLGRTRG